jgi:hypothetical protein
MIKQARPAPGGSIRGCRWGFKVSRLQNIEAIVHEEQARAGLARAEADRGDRPC